MKEEKMKTIHMTPFNVGMFIAGLMLIIVAVYRIAPIRLDFRLIFAKGSNLTPDLKIVKKTTLGMITQFVPLFLALVLIMWKTYAKGGSNALVDGIGSSFKTTGQFLPTMIVLFPLMAFGTVLAGFYKKEIEEMITGTYGYIGTLFSAFIIPTLNSAVGPIQIHWKNYMLQPIIQYFMTSAALICWPLVLFRALGFDWEIALPMYRTNWIVSIIIMPGFMLWSKAVACGGWWKAIKVILHLG